MTSLVLDAGAFVAVERNDRDVVAAIRAARDEGLELRTHAMIVAQVWRRSARQASLNRVLRAVEVIPIDENLGRSAGGLLARSRTDDPIDAAVVLVADDGDTVMTSDPGDIRTLARAAGRRLRIERC
jgi:hypothetical protein